MGWSRAQFRGSEVIEIALKMEEAGKIYYEKASQLAKDDKLKDMLLFLGQEEEKHIQDFMKVGENLTDGFMPTESYEGEYDDYVGSLVNSHVFNMNRVEDVLKEIKTDKDILLFALNFEKDSIVFFQEIKMMGNETAAKVIEDLINQERGHIRKIGAVFKNM